MQRHPFHAPQRLAPLGEEGLLRAGRVLGLAGYLELHSGRWRS